MDAEPLDGDWWRQLEGFKVMTLYTAEALPFEGGVEAAAAVALYWPSAAELARPDRHGRRNEWWTDAPELTGDRDVDVDRIRRAPLEETPAVDRKAELRRGQLALLAAAC